MSTQFQTLGGMTVFTSAGEINTSADSIAIWDSSAGSTKLATWALASSALVPLNFAEPSSPPSSPAIFFASSAPAGTWPAGSICFNSSPQAGGFAGHVYVSSVGWRRFGIVEY